MKRIIRVTEFIFKLTLAYVCAFFIRIFRKEMRNVWIISERGIDARDNGYFFYKYVAEKHPEQPIWYIIDGKSADTPKVQRIGRWIEYGSLKHYIFYAIAKVRISSSFWGGDLPKADYFNKLKKYIGRNKKFVFLKHGIVKDYLPQHCYGEGYPNIYVCGAKPEYDYIHSYFGYPEGIVKYLGLARFDNLHDTKTKNQILFMPTFRKWLTDMSDEEFIHSDYFNKWQNIIQDTRLIRLLEENRLELIFYPHIMLQKKIYLFTSRSDAVKVAEFREYDVQTLLKESKLLITDFSSVFFDFGYMGKPVVYYWFDTQKYVQEHYDFTKGYFSYEKDGFGDIVADEDSLVNAISQCINCNFNLNDKYKKRIDEFFPLKDRQNCERIYNEVVRLKK